MGFYDFKHDTWKCLQNKRLLVVVMSQINVILQEKIGELSENYMKVAVVGSRTIQYFDLSRYLPEGTTEIVSGGAVGVDTVAKNYALENNIKYTEFLPNYKTYGSTAPLVRNYDIINYADHVLVFWDGLSSGSRFVIEKCREYGIPVSIYMPTSN